MRPPLPRARDRTDYTDEHCGQNNSPTSCGDPGGQDEFAAALNLRSKLLDVLLKADDLLVRICTS
jgi:hypothetical protein